MKEIEKFKHLAKQLETVLHSMDVPIQRKSITDKNKVEWLSKNLRFKNENHPKFEIANNLIQELVKLK